MKNYCTQLFQQQAGLTRWKRLDDVATKFRHCYNRSLQYTPLRRTEHTMVCKFASGSQHASIIAFATNFGRLEIFDLDRKDPLCHCWIFKTPIFDFAWVPEQMYLLASGVKQRLILWDIAVGMRPVSVLDHVLERSEHNDDAVTSVAVCKENPFLCVYGIAEHGQIEFCDMRNGLQRVRRIYNTHKLQTNTNNYLKKSVTGLVFKDTNSVVSCTGYDSTIKLWDFRYMRYDRVNGRPIPQQTFAYKGSFSDAEVGFSSLVVDDYNVKLYANCTDTHIYCYNINSTNSEPIMKYQDTTDSCQIPYDFGSHIRLSLSKDGSYILNGSCDNSAFIWNTNLSHPIVRLNHEDPVCCVAWQPTYGYDQTLVTSETSQWRSIWRISAPESDTDSKFDAHSRYKVINVYPTVPNQLKLTNHEKILGQQVRPCKKCFNGTTDIYCKKCLETRVTKFLKHNRFSPYCN